MPSLGRWRSGPGSVNRPVFGFVIALLVGVAYLFRQEHGLNLGLAALVTVALAPGATRVMKTRLVTLCVFILLVLLPCAIYPRSQGIVSAAWSSWEFSRREADRLHLAAYSSGDDVRLYYLFHALPLIAAAFVALDVRRGRIDDALMGAPLVVLAFSPTCVFSAIRWRFVCRMRSCPLPWSPRGWPGTPPGVVAAVAVARTHRSRGALVRRRLVSRRGRPHPGASGTHESESGGCHRCRGSCAVAPRQLSPVRSAAAARRPHSVSRRPVRLSRSLHDAESSAARRWQRAGNLCVCAASVRSRPQHILEGYYQSEADQQRMLDRAQQQVVAFAMMLSDQESSFRSTAPGLGAFVDANFRPLTEIATNSDRTRPRSGPQWIAAAPR